MNVATAMRPSTGTRAASAVAGRNVGRHRRRVVQPTATVPSWASSLPAMRSADPALHGGVRQLLDRRPYGHPLPQGRRRFAGTAAAASAWWNPFGRSGVRDTDPRLASARTRSDSDAEHPRRVQERKDLTLLLLAAEFRKASLLQQQQQQQQQQQEGAPSAPPPSRERERLVDVAFERLDEMEVDSKTMMQLRHALQSELEPQVADLFGLFGAVDEELLLLSPASVSEEEGHRRIDALLDDILQLEWERTVDELANPATPLRASKGADPTAFLSLKRRALETLLDRRRRKPVRHAAEGDGSTNHSPAAASPSPAPPPDSWVDADEFGYHETIDAERNHLIRYYQAVNLCRAAKLRHERGYSVVALRSSIPGAGRGVYVDGYAGAGSVLAFQPGLVWDKESLVNLSVEEERLLEKNDMYQMSLRPDDYMIDSRKSPYTVLTDENSNLMALGHVVNHPTPTNPPNARSAMFNFTAGMGLDGGLKRYIPNTYARPRNLTLLGSLWDRDVIDMHSMVLVATRDVCNEEVFYDYRLATSHFPQWYHPVKDTAYMDDGGTDEELDKNDGSRSL